MKGLEEIPKGRNPDVYFSSLYHLNPTASFGRGNNPRSVSVSNNDVVEASDTNNTNGTDNSARQSSNKRKRVNYNVQQIQAEQFLTSKPKNKSFADDLDNETIDLTGDYKSTLSIAELRKANRRFDELDRENYAENIKIEIPKNVTGLIVKRDTDPGPVVKRLLISKKTWSNYMDELSKKEIRLVFSNNTANPLEAKPNNFKIEKLCTICGGVSYSSCIKCGARVCSVKCQHIHDETRCTHF